MIYTRLVVLCECGDGAVTLRLGEPASTITLTSDAARTLAARLLVLAEDADTRPTLAPDEPCSCTITPRERIESPSCPVHRAKRVRS